MTSPRIKLMTDPAYFPTTPANEEAVRDLHEGMYAEIFDNLNAGKAEETEVVHNTLDETIAGIKTFSSSPIVPTPTTNMQASTKKYVDDTTAGVVLGQIPDGTITPTKLNFDPATQAELDTHAGLTATTNAHGLDSSIAKFKVGSSTYTDNDTSQTFTDAFCTASSLVVVSITGTTPQGTWSVTSGAGSFTITSTVAESADVTFDYYITKVV